MNGVFEIPTIVFLLLAAFLVFRLISVLGRKTGNERPVEGWRRGEQEAAKTATTDNVVPMARTGSGDKAEPAGGDAPAAEERIKGAAPTGSPLETDLLAIARKDASFDPRTFLSGAKTAYEMIVTAYASGDRKQLKNLTAREVFDGFARAISEREGRGEVHDMKFIGIHKADLIDAELKDMIAKVTVKFVSQLITAVRDKAGSVIEGDPNQVREVTDIWTFARETASRDPNWKLVATQSAN